MVAEHPNKHIRAAIEHALNHGWTLQKAGPRAHLWGRLFCPQGDLVLAASAPSIQHRNTPKIMPKIFGERLTNALMADLELILRKVLQHG
jgi:hypothetical protein